MDLQDLRSVISSHFAGFTVEPDNLLDLLLVKGAERHGFALCPEREAGMAYLGAFETAMQRLIDAHNSESPPAHLGLAVAFASAAAGKHPSYRRALKKYSNSIVFEDIGISLYLVESMNQILILSPDQVNPFLRNLNEWIADHRPNAAKSLPAQ